MMTMEVEGWLGGGERDRQRNCEIIQGKGMNNHNRYVHATGVLFLSVVFFFLYLINPFSATRHYKRHQNKVKVGIVHIIWILDFFFMVL